MTNTKVIGFFGVQKQDICTYLAAILNNLGNKILIADRSKEQEFRNGVPECFHAENLITYKNIDYQFRDGMQVEKFNNYNFVLLDMGKLPEWDMIDRCEEIYLIADSGRKCVTNYREVLHGLVKPVSIILRNTSDYKVTADFLWKKLIPEEYKIIDQFVLPFDGLDKEYALAMQYEPYNEFKCISNGFEKMLIRITANLTIRGSTEVIQAMKMARKGKCI